MTIAVGGGIGECSRACPLPVRRPPYVGRRCRRRTPRRPHHHAPRRSVTRAANTANQRSVARWGVLLASRSVRLARRTALRSRIRKHRSECAQSIRGIQYAADGANKLDQIDHEHEQRLTLAGRTPSTLGASTRRRSAQNTRRYTRARRASADAHSHAAAVESAAAPQTS
jgi:hypothetical protein